MIQCFHEKLWKVAMEKLKNNHRRGIANSKCWKQNSGRKIVTFMIVTFMTFRTSPLVLAEILGVFVNSYTADGKYPVQYCENLQLPIEMQLSEKRKTFSQFFVPFLESTTNFKHFEKRDDRHN